MTDMDTFMQEMDKSIPIRARNLVSAKESN